MSSASSGSIFKSVNPSGKTVYKVEVAYGFHLDGRRRKTRRTASTMAEARILQRQLIADIESSRLAPARDETLETYGLSWIRNEKANQVRYSTASDYETRFRNYINPYLGKNKLGALEPKTITMWMQKLKDSGLSTKTVNGARTILFGIYEHAHRMGVLSRNPVRATRPHRQQRDETTQVQDPWDKAEVIHALEVSQNTDFDLFINIAIGLGLRRGEILGLKWSDIDLDNGMDDSVLKVRRTLKEERRLDSQGKATVRLTSDKPKTKASERKLKLGLSAYLAIQRHKHRVDQMRADAGASWVETDWVFVAKTGGPLFPSNVSKRFVAFCKAQGLRRIRLHDLRHTAAVLGLEAGVRLEAVTQALGHSRTDVTKGIYAPYVQVLADEFTIGVDDAVNSVLLQKHFQEDPDLRTRHSNVA